jgi:hypothetical protein
MMRTAASWAILLMLGTSFAVLAYTSSQGSSSAVVPILVAVVGFVLVFGLWFGYREFSLHATLTRAVAIGDHEEVKQLVTNEGNPRIRMPGTMPLAMYHAQSLEQSGQFDEALKIIRTLDSNALNARAKWAWQISAMRVALVAEKGDAIAAKEDFARSLAGVRAVPRTAQHAAIALVRGRLLMANQQAQAALDLMLPLTNEIQLGPTQRAVAHAVCARALVMLGDPGNAQAQHAQAVALAPGSWMAAAPRSLV